MIDQSNPRESHVLTYIAAILLVGVGTFLSIFTQFVETRLIGGAAIEPLTAKIFWWIIFLAGIMSICFGALIPMASIKREKKSE